jgi:hypothetical protein
MSSFSVKTGRRLPSLVIRKGHGFLDTAFSYYCRHPLISIDQQRFHRDIQSVGRKLLASPLQHDLASKRVLLQLTATLKPIITCALVYIFYLLEVFQALAGVCRAARGRGSDDVVVAQSDEGAVIIIVKAAITDKSNQCDWSLYFIGAASANHQLIWDGYLPKTLLYYYYSGMSGA